MDAYQFRSPILSISPWIQNELKTKTVLLHPQNGSLEFVPPRGSVPNRLVGEISHFNVTCWNDNFDFLSSQVTRMLPLGSNL